MRIDEFEFQDRNGNEIEPTKNQLVVYIKSLHKQIAELQKQLEEKEKYTYTGWEVELVEKGNGREVPKAPKVVGELEPLDILEEQLPF